MMGNYCSNHEETIAAEQNKMLKQNHIIMSNSVGAVDFITPQSK
jgi:hypothetical protein